MFLATGKLKAFEGKLAYFFNKASAEEFSFRETLVKKIG